jgi:hypothetical protein
VGVGANGEILLRPFMGEAKAYIVIDHCEFNRALPRDEITFGVSLSHDLLGEIGQCQLLFHEFLGS